MTTTSTLIPSTERPVRPSSRRIAALVLASAVVMAGVAAEDGGSSTPRAAAGTARSGSVLSADAAERWAARGTSIRIASPDAVERRAAAEQQRAISACAGGSADAMERCALAAQR